MTLPPRSPLVMVPTEEAGGQSGATERDYAAVEVEEIEWVDSAELHELSGSDDSDDAGVPLTISEPQRSTEPQRASGETPLAEKDATPRAIPTERLFDYIDRPSAGRYFSNTLLTPGDKLKDYEAIAPITSGGMATLVLARRRGVGGFSRLVALKLVHPHLAQDGAMINMFLDEARISAHIVHPNVVHVEEVGVEDGIYFIAMEYVHGVSLAHLQKRLSQDRRRMSPTLAVVLASQVAEALHAAHEATDDKGHLHIVHRDVSPQNILLAHTGHVKLIDFGIAKSQAALHESRTGAGVLGKLRYMSPEQLRLDPIDRRTDVYALGVVLWELLTARNLLRCTRIDDPRDQAIRDRPPPPSRYASLVKPALDKVVLKALAPRPEDRFATALELRRALLRAQPEAARVDAPKLAAMLHAVVGEELDAQRAALPKDVTKALALADTLPQQVEEDVSLSELTMELPQGDFDSGETQVKESGPFPPVPARASSTALTDGFKPQPGHLSEGVPYSWLAVSCVLCTLAGLWIGRTTARFDAAPVVSYPSRVDVAAAQGATFAPDPRAAPAPAATTQVPEVLVGAVAPIAEAPAAAAAPTTEEKAAEPAEAEVPATEPALAHKPGTSRRTPPKAKAKWSSRQKKSGR